MKTTIFKNTSLSCYATFSSPANQLSFSKRLMSGHIRKYNCIGKCKSNMVWKCGAPLAVTALTAQKPTCGFTDDAPAQLTSRRILDPLNLTGTRPGGVMSHCPTSHSGPQRTCGGPRKKWAACGRQRLGQGDTDTRERQLAGQWKGLSAHAKENAPLFCFCLTILMILNIQMSLQNYSYLNNASRPLASASVGALPARSCHSHQHTHGPRGPSLGHGGRSAVQDPGVHTLSGFHTEIEQELQTRTHLPAPNPLLRSSHPLFSKSLLISDKELGCWGQITTGEDNNVS